MYGGSLGACAVAFLGIKRGHCRMVYLVNGDLWSKALSGILTPSQEERIRAAIKVLVRYLVDLHQPTDELRKVGDNNTQPPHQSSETLSSDEDRHTQEN